MFKVFFLQLVHSKLYCFLSITVEIKSFCSKFYFINFCSSYFCEKINWFVYFILLKHPTEFDDLFSIVFTIKFLLRNMISYYDMILLKLYIRYLHSVWIIWTNYSVIIGKRAFQEKNQTSKYLFVRVIFLVSKDRSKSTKGGGPSPLNICNMPYFLKKIWVIFNCQ